MEKDLIDMHTHTIYSDGELSPNNLIVQAKKRKIKTIAITDHDTLLGNKNITLSTESKEGIIIIPGIELSAQIDKGRMHILGYNIDITNKELNDKMIELKNKSLYSVLGHLTQLKKDYNITFSTEDIVELMTAEHNIGRPDLARLCVKYGYAQNVKDAFNKYLDNTQLKTKATRKGIPYEECFKLIKNAGGIPVLAHPNSLEKTDEELIILLEEMIKYGLEGIEVYHSSHTIEETNKYLNLSKKYNLLVSGGSDFHGPNTKPDIELGTGKNNNLKIKELTILNKIRKD